MGLDLIYQAGQTPLDEDEKQGLMVPGITTVGQLNEFEQQSIEQAVGWTFGKKFNAGKVLTEDFICMLHKRMFKGVWNWAGQFRKTNKNIGVDKHQISIQLRGLLQDTLFWIENGTYGREEIVIRFKHRLVNIHCFPNGNGRHSRLMADILAMSLGVPVFTWGSGSITAQGDVRRRYLQAIWAADKGDLLPLCEFARS